MPNKLEEAGISWVVIGSQTKPYRPPAISDVEEIVRACDKAGIPVFLKDNLAPLLNPMNLQELQIPLAPFYTEDLRLRQEMPE